VAGRYVPERGDVVRLSFNPQAGHEQSGHRPAVVISPRAYNRRVGLALFCPVTSQAWISMTLHRPNTTAV